MNGDGIAYVFVLQGNREKEKRIAAERITAFLQFWVFGVTIKRRIFWKVRKPLNIGGDNMLFTNKSNKFAKDPAVVNLQGTYFLYYTILYERLSGGNLKIGVGIAKSSDMENWEEIGEVPLEQECEQKGIGAPAAIVIDGKVNLFYQTYGSWEKDAICHAVSEDGIHFVKNPDNPILRPSADWCCGRAIDADVCIFRNKLYLYYATRDHAFRIQKVGGAYAEVDSDFSKKAWTQIGRQALVAPEMKWEGECIEAPATIVNDGKLFLFYGGSYNCTPQQIGVAVSEDGAFFEKLSAEPFLRCGKEGDWNSCESGHPYAFRDEDGRAYLFYQGTNDMGQTWYLSKVEIGFDENNMPYMIE